MKSIVNDNSHLLRGAHFELNTTTDEATSYYFAGASRIAVRKHVILQSNTLTYLLGDHLGSTSLAVDASTGDVVETRYKPWGEVRYATTDATLPTRYTFTGQYSYVSDDATDLGAAGFGLVFYNARWYDPALGRMAQADTVVPGGVQGLDRYAYVNNSPVNYVDPTGHLAGNCLAAIDGMSQCGGAGYSEPEPTDPVEPPDPLGPMDSEDFDYVIKHAKVGDKIVYEFDGETYGAICAQIVDGICTVWWDLRTRQSVNVWSLSAQAVGFYRVQPDMTFKRVDLIGDWENLPETLYVDNPEDYYGDKEMLVIQHIPTGTNCGTWCWFDFVLAAIGIASGRAVVAIGLNFVGVGDFVTSFEVYNQTIYMILPLPNSPMGSP